MAAEVPWLNPEERDAWLGLLGTTLVLPALLDAQLERDDHLNMFEYLVLAMLSESPDHSLQLKKLATLTNGSLSRLSHTVSRLENRGYLVRAAAPADRRAKVATLTEQGWAAVVAAAPSHVRHVRRLIFDPLSRDQVVALAEITQTILGHLGPECFTPLAEASTPRPT